MSIEFISKVLQALGIAIILGSQLVFLYRIRKKWHSLKKAFLALTTPQLGIEKERLSKMSKTELEEKFKIFRLAKFLYEDFITSVIGLVFSLIGTLLLFA